MFAVPFHFPFHCSVPYSIPAIRDAPKLAIGNKQFFSACIWKETSGEAFFQGSFSDLKGGRGFTTRKTKIILFYLTLTFLTAYVYTFCTWYPILYLYFCVSLHVYLSSTITYSSCYLFVVSPRRHLLLALVALSDRLHYHAWTVLKGKSGSTLLCRNGLKAKCLLY